MATTHHEDIGTRAARIEPVVPGEPPEIQTAEPDARRRSLMFLAVVTVVGVGLMIGVEQWLAQVHDGAHEDPHRAMDEIAYVIRVFGAVISLSLIGLALVLARVSWRTYVARRFPPPGMSLVVDVTVVKDAAAIKRAVLGFALATVLGAAAVFFPYLLWRTIVSITAA